MINTKYSFYSLTIEAALIAKCLVSEDQKRSVESTLALSTTSKTFHHVINTDPFFREFVKLINPEHPLFILKKESQDKGRQDESKAEDISFKTKYLNLRNIFLQKNETFPGAYFGDAVVSEEGVEIILFQEKILSFKPKENPTCNSIQIPENMLIPDRQIYRVSPYAARSEEFLAINSRTNSAIYIFTPEGDKCLGRCEVTGEICQLAIRGNLLCVVEKQEDGVHSLAVFDLRSPQQQDRMSIPLPENEISVFFTDPICFGENYLLYNQRLSQGYQIYALPLSCLKTPVEGSPWPWIKGPVTEGSLYMLPEGDHFIEVIFDKSFNCSISKIEVLDNLFFKTELVKDVVISDSWKNFPVDICFQNDRLFFAYKGTARKEMIFCYDLILGKVTGSIPTFSAGNGFSFRSRFLKTAINVYYLHMQLMEEPESHSTIQGDLITLTYDL